MFQKLPRLIVCAAIRKGLIVICGARHFDSVMREQLHRMALPPHGWEQGFIDQRGNFLSREEAWKIASDENQIRRDVGGPDGVLFSEHLY